MIPDMHKIMAAIAADTMDSRPRRHLFDLVSNCANRDELVYRAVQEGLAGLFYRGLKAAGALTLISTKLGSRLEQTYFHMLQINLQLENELAAVLEQMNDRSIQALFLQGISLQNDLYPEPGLRPMYDIDVWVTEPNFKAFSELLQRCGYKPGRFYPHTFKKGRTVFDIHTHLLWADRIRARRHLLIVPQEQLLSDAETFMIAGQPALRLNCYDQVLYLGLHLLKHNVERLIWLVDVRLLLERLTAAEWGELISRAELLGQTRTLAQVLFLLEDLLHYQGPAETRQFRQVNRLSTLERWVLRMRKRNGRLPGWSTLVLFPASMRRGRWMFIWETFFPQPEVLRQVFPHLYQRSAKWLYARRLLQLVALPFRK